MNIVRFAMKIRKLLLFFLLLGCIGNSIRLISNNPSFTRNSGFWSPKTGEKETKFFSKLTKMTSQRENWHVVTPYLAEFWCALSNIGFIYVGIQQKSPELLFAGLASFVSHSIPKQWLNYVDKVSVAFIAIKFLRNYRAFLDNSRLLLPVVALGAINLIDQYLARTKASVLPHVFWHLSAAGIMGYLLPKLKTA
jgi:hypothetical protein